MRTYGMSGEQQDAVWLGFRAGESINSIARAQLLPAHHVRRYLGQTGGIRPAPLGRSARQLSAAERDELSLGSVARSARPRVSRPPEGGTGSTTGARGHRRCRSWLPGVDVPVISTEDHPGSEMLL